MKHNTHIYLAAKAIEFLYDGLKNLSKQDSGQSVSPERKRRKRASAKKLQRHLQHYQNMIYEAAWAPDDIIYDKSVYHTFKLFTKDEFSDAENYAIEQHRGKYYRAKSGGGLPFKVDHLARFISDMEKLREYNDRFSRQQIMYQYLLISHYIVDAHVPMHCDLRDDPPSATDTSKPRGGEYFSERLHGKIEGKWDDAVHSIVLTEELIEIGRNDDFPEETDLTEYVKFDVTNDNHLRLIKPVDIKSNIMQFMIDVCIRTKDRSLEIFPIENPNIYDKEQFKEHTKEIFAETISDLISVWMWIWDN